MPVIAGRKLRAPRQHGEVLALPSFAEARALLQRPVDLGDPRIAGVALADFRRQAVHEMLEAAAAYLGTSHSTSPQPRLLVAGHQPELFHPGVWVKNFALNGLARSAGLVPVNLVVDNDTPKSLALDVPVVHADPRACRVDKLPIDDGGLDVPWEERPVRDESVLASVPQRAEALLASWPFRPLLSRFWRLLDGVRTRSPLLGERLVAARRALEVEWGCRNLEIPVSALCQTPSFHRFVAHLLLHAPRLHATYNGAVHAYRRVHHLRSRNHPVPDLALEGDWLELPLWAWRTGSRRRGRLLTRRVAGGIDLRAEGITLPTLPADPDALTSALGHLAATGFKIRTRALTTTLYSRLAVAEAFLHGIGGGKYDELTDVLLREFFEVQPPPYFVLSATYLLPFTGFQATVQDEHALARQLRDLRWNPQRHVPPPVAAVALAEQKRKLIASLAEGGPIGRGRDQELRRLTLELQPMVGEPRRQLDERLKQARAELAANAILRKRDYAFVLHPEQELRTACLGILDASRQPSG